MSPWLELCRAAVGDIQRVLDGMPSRSEREPLKKKAPSAKVRPPNSNRWNRVSRARVPAPAAGAEEAAAERAAAPAPPPEAEPAAVYRQAAPGG